MKFLKFYFCFILIFLMIQCNTDQKPNLASYLQSTSEVITFCKEMVPCVKEEINKAFKDLPQQREYLLSKTNIANCQIEQSEKLNALISPKESQVQSFMEELNKFQKDYSYAKKNNELNQFIKKSSYKIKIPDATLINIKPFLELSQNNIIENYIICLQKISKKNDCNIKKQIIKSEKECNTIFSYENDSKQEK